MNHFVADLSGSLLDRAVMKAEQLSHYVSTNGAILGYDKAGGMFEYSPSRNWSQGGPIIERERIELLPPILSSLWCATTCDMEKECYGGSPLVAAMRAYVRYAFGEFVDLDGGAA